METTKRKILILGKLPPPFFGPALATRILLESDLKTYYHLLHLNTKLNHKIESMYRVKPEKFGRLLWLYGKMLYFMIRYNPEIVVIPISQSTSGFFKDLPFIYLSILFKSKTIVHLRGSRLKSWLDSLPFLLSEFFRFSLKRCYGGIVLGSNLRFVLKNIFPSHRIFVVPNGGDFSIPGNRSTRNVFRILFLSNIQLSKGIMDVLRTTRILHDKHPGAFQLNIVGNWHDKRLQKRCKLFCHRHHLAVTFYSNITQKEKRKHLSESDLFIFPPREPEGHPWVIIEAMAAALPIIATDQGAIRESVIHGENGYIVEPARPDQIAGRIIELYFDRKKCEQMSQKSYTYYQRHFTEEKMVQNLKNVFDSILTEPCHNRKSGKSHNV
jgi:glycosyltransferase involved in cell wall biosynthesis